MAGKSFLDKYGFALIGIAVLAVALGYVSIPNLTGTSAITGGGTGGQPPTYGLTGNPSLNLTVIDEKTKSALNVATVDLLDAQGNLRATATTSAGVAAFTNLDPNTTYTAEIQPAGSTIGFYGLSVPVTTNPAGSKTQVVTYKSLTTTAPTITVYNNDDVTANTNAAAQAFGVNQAINYRIRVAPASSANDNNFFGDGVGQFVVVVDYNTTAVSQISLKDGGVTVPTTGVPSGHQLQDVNKTSSIAFLTNTKSLAPSTNTDFVLTVKAGAIEPVATDGTDDEMYITFYDGARVKNTLTGTFGEAWRDPVSQAQIGSSNAVSSIHYS